MSRWRRWICGCSTSCCECAGGAAMSAAPQIRTALMENLKELHLPAMRACFEEAAQRAEKETLSYEQYLLELARARVRVAATQPDREAAARVGAAAGEDAGELRPEAITGEGRTTTEGAGGRQLPGPQGELAAVRESWRGQEPLAVCPRPRTDRARTQDEVHHLRHAGAGSAGGQARSEAEQGDQEAGQVRRPDHRRHGLRAAEAERRWRCCSPCWRSVTNAAACC